MPLKSIYKKIWTKIHSWTGRQKFKKNLHNYINFVLKKSVLLSFPEVPSVGLYLYNALFWSIKLKGITCFTNNTFHHVACSTSIRCKYTQHNDAQHNGLNCDTQHTEALSVTIKPLYAGCYIFSLCWVLWHPAQIKNLSNVSLFC